MTSAFIASVAYVPFVSIIIIAAAAIPNLISRRKMVKTRSTSGSGRRLLKTKKSATPTKTVSRGSQTTQGDPIGVSAPVPPSDLSGFRFPPDLSVQLCPAPSVSSSPLLQDEDEYEGEQQTSTSKGGGGGRKRRAASSSDASSSCDTPGLSSPNHQHYACSNVAPATAGSVMNKKFLNLGEPSKKRRRNSNGSSSSSGSPERKKKRRRRHLEHDDEDVDEEEEDVNNLTDDDEFWSDLDGDVEGRSCDREEEEEENEEAFEGDNPPGDKVAYIHVGEGGEADLEAQLKGAENLDVQILEEEDLPDIDETDMIHGLDHTGTARDYVDDRHRCTPACPVGCQGHLRPNEIVIYESFKWKGKLRGRRR